MDWYGTVFALIELQSFSSVWYWIFLAAAWSWRTQHVLGVPYDMVSRAAHSGGQRQDELEVVLALRIARVLWVTGRAGPWVVGVGCAVLAGLGTLGFVYGVEFAQAVVLLALPLLVTWLMSANLAERIDREALTGEALVRTLSRHRGRVLAIAMVSIFGTALWGTYHNLVTGIFGF